jgi:hypothetical protein
MFGIGRSNGGLDPKTEKKILDDATPPIKRYQSLSKFTENSNENEVRPFYQTHYSKVYKIFLDALLALDSQAKTSRNKTIPTSDILALCNILYNLFKYVRNIIQKKWQQRSIIHYLECFLSETNAFPVKKKGLELLLLFLDIMQDGVDSKVIDLLMNSLKFEPFVEGDVKLPTYDIRDINEEERLRIATETNTAITESNSLELFNLMFSFIKTNSEQFDFWWSFFKSRLAPILYPSECKSLEMLNKLDDMGFTKKCPYKIHLLVLDTILAALETPKKAVTLYNTNKDIYMFLLVFRQSFMLPPQHFDSVAKMLKTYRSWICKDYFLYSWPDIMEQNRNTYFRVFIDNLAQTFYMEGEDSYLDIHMQLCYEVLEIFMYFTNIQEKVDFETWNDLMATHIQIAEHLIEKHTNKESYMGQLARYLLPTVLRNLFVLWIKAHPNDEYVELWNTFYEMAAKHMGLDLFFNLWKITVSNLTRSIINRVFGLPLELIDASFGEYSTEIFEHEKKGRGKAKIISKPHVAPQMQELFSSLEEDVLLHLWHMFINMHGIENKNLPGPLHTKKLKVITDMIDLFLSISQKEVKATKGSTPPPFLHSPEGNKLMKLFLEWLLEACERKDEDFTEGRCIAYATLCKILCQKFSQPFEKQYLSQAYRALHTGLTLAEGGTKQTTESIFLHGKHFFSFGHAGANLLIPDFIEGASRILRESQNKDLRIAAIQILWSLVNICFFYKQSSLPDISNVFKTKQVPSSDAGSSTNHMFIKLKTRICQILMLAVGDVPFPEFQIKCLWSLFLIIYGELVTSEVKYPSVSFITDCMLGFIAHNDINVAQTAQDCFIAMAHLQLFPRLSDSTIKVILCTICDSLISLLKQVSVAKVKLMKTIFYTLVEILSYIPTHVIEGKDVAYKLFNAVQLGLSLVPLNNLIDPKYKIANDSTGSNSSLSDQDKLHEVAVAAEVLLSFMLNTYNHFPCPSGNARMSSILSEFDMLEEGTNGIIEPSPKIHHFVFNDYTLLTVMESPSQTECCRIIVRDMTGKYCWEHKMVFSEQQATFKRLVESAAASKKSSDDSDEEFSADSGASTTKETPSSPKTNNPTPESTEKGSPKPQKSSVETSQKPPVQSEQQNNNKDGETAQEGQEVDYPHYDPDIDTDKTDMFEILQHYIRQVFPEIETYSLTSKVKLEDYVCDVGDIPLRMDAQRQSEQKLVVETEHEIFSPVIPPKKMNPIDLVVFKTFRALLNNIGYLHPNVRPSFYRIDANHKFYRSLKQLDKVGERETIKIGVIYVGNGQESARDLIKNESGSDLYQEFLQGLGWDVDLKTHVGFIGGLDPGLTTGLYAPYYANTTTEIIFHVVTNMPTKPNDQQQIHKKRHIGNDIVHIVWNEHDRDYRPWTITSQFNFVHIVIYPLKDPLFRIQIFSKPEVPSFGPLMDGMIVDKKSLAPLVRMTAVNANKAVRYNTDGYNKPYPTRRALINEIIDRYKMSNMKNEDFLKPLFFDQIYSGISMEVKQRRRSINEIDLEDTAAAAAAAVDNSSEFLD